jgi:PAS domain S-box-containing protein
MASHPRADRPSAPAAERGTLDTLISQARRLRGGVDAVRREAVAEDTAADPLRRWQRALCDLAVHQLDDLGQQLDQLRDGLPPEPDGTGDAACAPAAPSRSGPTVPCRAGSAEWNLLTDEVEWSPELYTTFGRTPEESPLSLDELPAWILPEDQPWMMEAVTDCLVDGRPIDGEFRITRQDGSVRTLHMVGEPVLAADGSTASMWAVVRDVSELRRTEEIVHETRDSFRHQRHVARAEHRLAVEMREAVLPPWRGSLRFPHRDGTRAVGALDLAAHYLPSAAGALLGGGWYDALELPDGGTLLTVGDLTGHGAEATSGMAMLLGAVRGMAVAGVAPGALMGHLNQLLDASAQPALGSALCCHYDPRIRTLTWAQAGHPAPLLYRSGTGRPLAPPGGVLLGATSGAVYGQHTERLEPGDLLVLHTDGLARPGTRIEAEVQSGTARLLGLAPRFASARTAGECVRTVVEEFDDAEREEDACALVARVCG